MSAKLTLTKVHDWKRQKNGVLVLQRTNPYIRIRQGEDPPIFIQHGTYFSEDGKEIEKVPVWVKTQVAKLTDAAKKEAGLDADDS